MKTLHVRNLPDELYQKIRKAADMQHRSMSAQVIFLLEQLSAIDLSLKKKARVLNQIKKNRIVLPIDAKPSELILREDRNR